MNPFVKSFVKFWRFLTNSNNKKKKIEVVHSLKRELSNRDEELTITRAKVRSLEEQLSKKSAEEKKKKEIKKSSNIKNQIADYLNKQKEFLDKERLGKSISLSSFFRKLYGVKVPKSKTEFDVRSKWGKKVRLEDKDGEVSYKFKDFKIYEKGFFVAEDLDKNIRAMSPNILNVLKPESLLTGLKLGRIRMAVNKDGEFFPKNIEEIENIEVPVPVYNEEKQEYEFSEVLVDKAKNIIMDWMDKFRDSEEKREALEISQGKLKTELSSSKTANKINQSVIEINKTDLSIALENAKDAMRTIGDAQQKITNLTEYKAYAEERDKVKDKLLADALARLELVGDYTVHDKVKAGFKDNFDLFSSMQMNPELLKIIEKNSNNTSKQLKVPLHNNLQKK